MAIKITKVTDLGNDILEVHGFDDSTMEEIVAHGWLSAMDYHYDAKHYGEDGHRKPGAQPRPMNDEEKQEYWLRLLQEQVKSDNVLFEHPDNIAAFENAKGATSTPANENQDGNGQDKSETNRSADA